MITLAALETHEKMCYKVPVQVKENQAHMIYDLIEKANAEESGKKEPDIDTESRKSRSRIPKKDAEETKGKRKRDSRSNSDESQKQLKLSRKDQKDSEAEISDNDSKSKKEEAKPDAPTTENKIETGKRTLKVSIERIPTKSKKAESNTKHDGTKEFSKKPLPKKYPL